MPRDDRPVEQARPARSSRQANPSASGKPRQRRGEATPKPSTAPEAKGAPAPGDGHAEVQQLPRLLQKYRGEIVPTLMKEFGYTVPLQAPRLQKVVLNVGMGEAITNPNVVESVTQMLATISGQHPVVTKARRSIATFKLRAGMNVGAMVTLRSRRMYDFVDRLVNTTLPRIRDFNGVPRTSFDSRGSYSIGIREQVIFPEIEYGKIDRIRGLQVTFVTSARSNQEAFRLLELLGIPFAHTAGTTRG